MSINYKLRKDFVTEEITSIWKTNSDSNRILAIPFSEGNTDYQEYLEWVAEGNTPEPADE